jgi:hypothetical protein
MSRLAVAVALWVAFVFIAWNVIYDRYVAVAAVEFTRQQILAYDRGAPLTPIHDGFSPRVRDAAWRASLLVSPIAVAGGVAIYMAFRRTS